MPILKGSASDFTATVKGSAEVNAAVGGAVARGGNSNPPRASGAIAAIVTQSAIAKSSGLQPTRFRVLASTAPAPAPAPDVPITITVSQYTGGYGDIFVVKYNRNGTVQWARRIASSLDDKCYGVASDSNGNIYVTGFYAGALSILAADGTTSALSLSVEGSLDMFVIKYSSDGTPLWARRLSGGSVDVATAIVTSASGDVYVIGYTQSSTFSVYAANSSTVLFSTSLSGSTDAVVVKYNTDGTAQWIRRIGGTGADQGLGIATDSSNNVYVTGYLGAAGTVFATTAGTGGNLTGTNISIASGGSNEGFIVKYASDGLPIWARRIGGSGDQRGMSIASDSSGNTYVCATLFGTTGSVFASDGTTVAFAISTAGSNDVVVVKYDTSGTPLWARRIAGPNDDQTFDIATDSSGNVYVTGQYTVSASVFTTSDGTTAALTLPSSLGAGDVFVVKYDTNGTPLWARRIGGTAGDRGLGISTDASGNVLAIGGYNATATVFASDGTTGVFTLTNPGTDDAYVVKYDTSGTPLWAARISKTIAFYEPVGISTDSNGNVIVAGAYNVAPLTIYSQGL